jgi:gamma-polyglutamate biosynthesis protein CapA
VSTLTSKQAPKLLSSTVILGGDIMLSRSIGYTNKKEWYKRMFASGNYHPLVEIPAFASWKALLFFNLESPFSLKDNDILDSWLVFRANTWNIVALDLLRKWNTMVLWLANNHVSNAGGLWIQTTRDILDQYKILHVGAGSSKQQASEILHFTHNEISRCVSAYSYDGNGWAYWGYPLYRNRADQNIMLQDLVRMQTLECDIKAMMIHRWAEYRMTPNKQQIAVAHSLVDSWLDLLIGTHSHVPWTIEHYKNKYIFYSLGNAIFDQDRGMTSVGKWMDTIYDETLQKNTVPTYITLFPVLTVTKQTTGASIMLDAVHTARLKKWTYLPNDKKTQENIIKKVLQQE